MRQGESGKRGSWERPGTWTLARVDKPLPATEREHLGAVAAGERMLEESSRLKRGKVSCICMLVRASGMQLECQSCKTNSPFG